MICTKSIWTASDIGVTTGGSTAYSSIVDLQKYAGYDGTVSLLITTAANGSATSFAITQQCSVDKANWYTPVSAYNATVDAVYTQAATVTGHTRFVQITPVLAPYIRFKGTTNSVGTIAMSLIYQEAL